MCIFRERDTLHNVIKCNCMCLAKRPVNEKFTQSDGRLSYRVQVILFLIHHYIKRIKCASIPYKHIFMLKVTGICVFSVNTNYSRMKF